MLMYCTFKLLKNSMYINKVTEWYLNRMELLVYSQILPMFLKPIIGNKTDPLWPQTNTCKNHEPYIMIIPV